MCSLHLLASARGASKRGPDKIQGQGLTRTVGPPISANFCVHREGKFSRESRDRDETIDSWLYISAKKREKTKSPAFFRLVYAHCVFLSFLFSFLAFSSFSFSFFISLLHPSSRRCVFSAQQRHTIPLFALIRPCKWKFSCIRTWILQIRQSSCWFLLITVQCRK